MIGLSKATRQLYGIFGAVLAILAVIAVLNVTFLQPDRQTTRTVAVSELGNLALSIERSVVQEIAASGRTLEIVSLLAPSLQAAPDTSSAISRILGPVTLLDAKGQAWPLAGMPAALPAANYAQARFFQDLRDTSGMTTTTRSDPLGVGLVLARRLDTPGNGFGGAVVTAIESRQLTDMLNQFDLGDGGSVTLLTDDGRLLAFGSRGASRPGMDLSKSEVFQHIINQGVGAFDATSVVDGRRRVYVSRRIPNAPIFLTVGTSLQTIYAPWRAVAQAEIVAVVALAVLIVVFALAFRRELRFRRASEAASRATAVAASRSERILHTYFDHMAHGVLGVRARADGQFEVERVNASALRMLDMPDAILGRDLHDLPSAARMTDLVSEFERCLTSGHPVQRDVHVTADGRSRSLRLTVTPIAADADDATRLLLASLEDVTLQESARAALLKTSRSSGLERIASGVANEFNNLLQSMVGHIEILAESVGEDTQAGRHARSALEAAARGTKLTQGLLSSSSQQLLRPDCIPIDRLLDDVRAAFTASKDDRVELVTERRPSTGSLGLPAAFADAGHLKIALLNICQNAQEAMLPKGGRLTIRAVARTDASAGAAVSQGQFVVFSITDEGCGMTADTLARAREPFFTTKGERFRLGLGLSTADGFAIQSGGELRLESFESGTTVELWVPAARTPAVSEGLPAEQWCILLVDDTAEQLAILGEILEHAGSRVVAVANSEEALAHLQSGMRFDLLITDYIMPGMDGVTLISAALDHQPGIAALLITGAPDTPDLQSIPGPVGMLPKPFRADQLLRSIRQLTRSPTECPVGCACESCSGDRQVAAAQPPAQDDR